MKRLSNELFDKYLAGTADPEESLIAKEAIRKNPQLNRIYIISRRYRAMMDAHKKQADILPMERKAAETSDNLCDIFCERYFLRERFPGYEKKENSPEENEQNFQQNAGKDGVPLYKVGYLLDSRGLVVQRQYGASLDDLKRYLERGESVIAVIDEDILKQTELDDMLHTVCVLGLNDDNVTLYNPTSDGENNHGIETHPLESFLQAWHPSEYYLVRVSTPEETVYEPHPVDLDDVDIDEELHDLIHPIAENLHDVWSKDRLQKGIQYGPLDKKGHERPGFNHYLVPFSQLSDQDQLPDINSARIILKLLKRSGYSIVRNDPATAHTCPDCGYRIEYAMSYCPHCGRELQVDDYLDKR